MSGFILADFSPVAVPFLDTLPIGSLTIFLIDYKKNVFCLTCMYVYPRLSLDHVFTRLRQKEDYVFCNYILQLKTSTAIN